MRIPSRTVIVAALLLALAGCAGGNGDDDPGPGTDPPVSMAPPEVPPLLGGDDGIDHWPETVVTIEADDGPLVIAAKVADSSERRQQGLMRVPELPSGVGMLFLFDAAHTGGFWMKDTLVPLDIAYLADGEVVAVLQMDPCEDDPCPTYDPGEAYDAALEVAQGTFAEAGVEVGARVTWTEVQEASP